MVMEMERMIDSLMGKHRDIVRSIRAARMESGDARDRCEFIIR